MTNVKASTKPASGSSKAAHPDGGGDPVRQAREWGGGSKSSKGSVTAADRRNEQSSSRS